MDNLDQYLNEWIQYPGLRALEIKTLNMKTWKCGRCGAINLEDNYDCWNCKYSSGGD